MQFKSNNKIIKFNPPYKDFPLKPQDKSRSGKQYLLGQYLAKVFGTENILEDCPIPGTNNLSWDFWIPKFNIAFEYDGEQHEKFNKFFHKDKAAFARQKIADATKQKIAEINNISLIRITHQDSITESFVRKLILKGN